MKARTHLKLLAGLFSLATLATPAVAGLAVDINSNFAVGDGSGGSSSVDETVGYAFTLSQSVTVTHLGVLDYVNSAQTNPGAAAGLLEDHRVRIWNADGSSVVASGTVAIGACSNPVATASAAEQSSWCFVDIADVTLTAGDYVIGADYSARGGDYQRYRLHTDVVTVMSGMSLGQPRVGVTGFPSTVDSSLAIGYFGPNFLTASVPEPGSLALLGLGLAGLIAARRRKQ